MRHITLTQKQYDEMDVDTRRSLIQQIMFIETKKNMYCIGAQGSYWTIVRYDKAESIGVDKFGNARFDENYKGEIIERWL